MNHLTKEQKKRFDDKYKFEGLFKGDELIGLNILKISIKQHLADEIARAKGEIINRLEDLIKCDKCDGIGAYSSPSYFGSCSDCEGTGVYIDGCFDDVLALLKREKENND